MRYTKIAMIFTVLLYSHLGCRFNTDSKTSTNLLFPKNENAIPVTDYSDVLTYEEENRMNKKIIAYEENTGNEVAILILDSIPNSLNILEYSTDVANQWGIGKKELDNGLFLVMAHKQKQIAIATGYGTEKVLTDSICKHIIDKNMIPKFKDSLYYEGFSRGLDSLIAKWQLPSRP